VAGWGGILVAGFSLPHGYQFTSLFVDRSTIRSYMFLVAGSIVSCSLPVQSPEPTICTYVEQVQSTVYRQDLS